MKTDQLYRVTAAHFVAGLVVRGGIIVEAAPIIRWSQNTLFSEFYRYAGSKGWTVELRSPALKSTPIIGPAPEPGRK